MKLLSSTLYDNRRTVCSRIYRTCPTQMHPSTMRKSIEYTYIDREDIRILARNPIVYQDENKTDQVATSSNVATADNICYGSAIPRDHVPTSDNVAYGSTIH